MAEAKGKTPRVRLTISISKEALAWIDQQVDSGEFYNRSHAIEKLLLDKMKQKKPGRQPKEE